MTIDEAVKVWLPVIQMGVETMPECKEALDMAIDTMRKYQKIQEIMDELNGNFYGSYLKDRQTLEKIYEVMEDGKID